MNLVDVLQESRPWWWQYLQWTESVLKRNGNLQLFIYELFYLRSWVHHQRLRLRTWRSQVGRSRQERLELLNPVHAVYVAIGQDLIHHGHGLGQGDRAWARGGHTGRCCRWPGEPGGSRGPGTQAGLRGHRGTRARVRGEALQAGVVTTRITVKIIILVWVSSLVPDVFLSKSICNFVDECNAVYSMVWFVSWRHICWLLIPVF